MEWIGPYKIQEEIGVGAYGSVYKGWDSKKNETVALKMIRKMTMKVKGVRRPEIREIPLLQQMQHENIVRLQDVQQNETHWYLVFEYMDMDYYKYMKTYPDIAKQPHKIKTFLRQILRGVAYCHSRNIMHRDLKPKNLLVDYNTGMLKLADFGLARMFSDTDTTFSPKLGTGAYRSPEILLGSSQYSTTTDMWSVGCIFAEMVNLKPLFSEKGSHLRMMFSLSGTPNEQTWPGVTSLPNFIDFPDLPREDLATVVPSLGPEGCDLLSKMLCIYPDNRITAQDALEHEYFKKAELVP